MTRKRSILSAVLIVLLFLTGVAYAQQPGRANDCINGYLPSRLYGGMLARVTPGGTANRIRANPTYNSEVTGSAPPETPLYVTTAPSCADGVVFWQVQFRDIGSTSSGIEDFGWTAEGSGGEYWLEPTYQTWNVATNRAPITTANLNQLQNLGQVQYGMVNNLVWSPDGALLAINTVGAIWIHNLQTPGLNPLPIAPNQLDTNHTTDIAFSQLGSTLITVGDALQSWNLLNGAQISIAPINTMPGSIKAIGSNGTVLAASNGDGSISLIDTQTNQQIRTLNGHSLVGVLLFNPKGSILASGGGSGMIGSDTTVRLWDVASGNQVAIFEVGEATLRMAFGPNGNMLAVPAADPSQEPSGSILMIDMNTRSIIRTLQLGSLAVNTGGLAFSPDGSILAAADNVAAGTKVVLFDTQTGNQIASIAVPAAVTALAFSPNGTLLAIAYEDPNFWGPNRVEVWGILQ